MDRNGLPLLALRSFRFSDIDEFRSTVRNLDVEFTPFVRKISAAQVNDVERDRSVITIGGARLRLHHR